MWSERGPPILALRTSRGAVQANRNPPNGGDRYLHIVSPSDIVIRFNHPNHIVTTLNPANESTTITRSYNINQSNDQSINQSITQSLNQSITQSIHQANNQSISQLINPSINQSTNQLINKPTNQYNQCIGQPNRAINLLTTGPTNQSTNQSNQ